MRKSGLHTSFVITQQVTQNSRYLVPRFNICEESTLGTHSANCPSEEMTTSDTKWEWPVSERWG